MKNQIAAVLLSLCSCHINASDQFTVAATRWIQNEFTPSTLTADEQLEELRWFNETGRPYRDMTIRVVSERIDTHHYESTVLTKAFYELTGIRVIHEVTGEDDVIKKLRAQIETDINLYDAFISDSDLIGYHFRSGHIYPISDFIASEGKEITLPTLDLNDFIGLKFTTAPDGKIYQLPDQQFANLYWYRHDWFSRPELQQQFQERYGYPLGVPKNWSAYEDIAEFFTNHVRYIDGQRVWGHMDYAKRDPSLGWRMSDAWLSMAGVGDKGLPNGTPVDEWGIRTNGCHPAGATVERGGALNSPAAIYAARKYIEWLKNYAPPEARDMNFTESGSQVGKGNIAQQIFWYTAFTASMVQPNLPVVDRDGTPKWRMAPTPHGAYWQPGMKLGYQDTGAWTLLRNTPHIRRSAAWLYAQFTVSKTVSLKKTMIGLTPIRHTDIEADAMTAMAPKLGGLVEFYRSRGRDIWTPTGSNVPDYIRMSPNWWKHISEAVSGNTTPAEAMTAMAKAMDFELAEIAMSKELTQCLPKLNSLRSAAYWLDQPGAPKPTRNESPQGTTRSYEESLQDWR